MLDTRRDPYQTETALGRLIRDIRRKIAGHPIEAAFETALARAVQIRSQQQRQRGWKLYSFHAPEVECIGKGKARTPWEFGVKVSIVATNDRAPGGQFVLHAAALPGSDLNAAPPAPFAVLDVAIAMPPRAAIARHGDTAVAPRIAPTRLSVVRQI